MGQPLPPGDNVPLIEGLDASWNEFVSVIPEDKRTELGPKLKERVSSYENQVKEFEPWSQFQKSGVTPDHVDTALRIFDYIEKNPKDVYEAIGKSLGITTAEAKEVMQDAKKEIKEGDPSDPKIQALEQQVATMAQIMVANQQLTVQEQQAAQMDAEVDREMSDLKKKYGDFNEREVLMRMAQDGMSAEDAYQDYNSFVTEIRSRRPAPMIMGSGGTIPSRAIDVTKLDSKATRNLVAQMFEHDNAERNQ